MFSALTTLIKNAKKANPNKLVKQVLANTSIQHDILDLNREEQLFDKGIDSTGDSLGEYSPVTIQGTVNFKGKIAKGQPIDRITLKDTGEFYESFRFKNNKDNFVIQADTLKEGADLIEDFGKDILGLTDGSLEKVTSFIKEPIRVAILAQLQK